MNGKKIMVILPALSLAMAFGTIPEQTKKPAPIPKAVMERGKSVYDAVCAACHMPDGAGVPRMNPPLAGSKTLKGPKEKSITIALNGLSGVEINGDRYDNVMASHADLTDQQLADVLTFARNSFGNKASLVSAAEVAKVRAKKK
jgi:mono/diheme cytochrome c family protein